MKINAWFLMLGIAFLPFAANATDASLLSQSSLSDSLLADDGEETPIPQHTLVSVRITNIGFHAAQLSHMVAEYNDGHSETHDLEGVSLKHGDNVLIPLTPGHTSVKTTVFFHGRTRLAFDFTTTETPAPHPQPEPQPEPAPQPEPQPIP